MKKNLYEILGIQPDSSPDEIKAAYRLLSLKHHPDTGGDPDLFVEINKAYKVLMDPAQRANYDEFGMDDDEMQRIVEIAKTIFNAALIRGPINIQKAIDDICMEKRRENKAKIAAFEKGKSVAQDVFSRIKKAPARDFIGAMINRAIKDFERQIAECEEKSEHIITALSMLNEYIFAEKEQIHDNNVNNVDEIFKDLFDTFTGNFGGTTKTGW